MKSHEKGEVDNWFEGKNHLGGGVQLPDLRSLVFVNNQMEYE